MSTYRLRLLEDTFDGNEVNALAVPAANRVLYARSGDLLLRTKTTTFTLETGHAWHGSVEPTLRPRSGSAVALRFELVPEGLAVPPGPDEALGVTSRLLFERSIDLDPTEEYLMRCDRVDFLPGGIAPAHRHRGPGIRYLIAGALEVRVAETPPRLIKVGDAWFESGADPVYAKASSHSPTSFIRLMILPRSIKGMSSLAYVDFADAQRGTPRAYTVYVDEPIELG